MRSKSRFGQGTTFTFDIQCEHNEKPKTDPIHHDQSCDEAKKSQLSADFARQYPYRILVAEDIVMNQKLIIWVLNKLGYQPELANNGLEVLEIMRRDLAISF